jgi:hypothetical protein
MLGHQSNPNITKDTNCWGIIVSYKSNDGQQLDGNNDWLEPLQNLIFEEAEQKAEQLNKQLKDNV